MPKTVPVSANYDPKIVKNFMFSAASWGSFGLAYFGWKNF